MIAVKEVQYRIHNSSISRRFAFRIIIFALCRLLIITMGKEELKPGT
jgi:hypothetical protein